MSSQGWNGSIAAKYIRLQSLYLELQPTLNHCHWVVFLLHNAGVLNYSEQLIVEHERGDWYLHCGRYVAQQGGCVTCFLHKTGVLDFCPWHQDDDPDHFRSNHQILHLVGKVQPSGEINVMGYIDEFPLQCQLLFSTPSRIPSVPRCSSVFAPLTYRFCSPFLES